MPGIEYLVRYETPPILSGEQAEYLTLRQAVIYAGKRYGVCAGIPEPLMRISRPP